MAWLGTFFKDALAFVFSLVASLLGKKVGLLFTGAMSLVALYSTLFMGVVILVKSTVMAVRVAFPPILVASTYFLPSNLPVILATIVSVRVSIVVYRWTLANLRMIGHTYDQRVAGPQI